MAARGRPYSQFYQELYRARERLGRYTDIASEDIHAQVQVTGHYRDPRTGQPHRLHGAVPVPDEAPWTAEALTRFAQMAERRLRTRYDKIPFGRICIRFVAYVERRGPS